MLPFALPIRITKGPALAVDAQPPRVLVLSIVSKRRWLMLSRTGGAHYHWPSVLRAWCVHIHHGAEGEREREGVGGARRRCP